MNVVEAYYTAIKDCIGILKSANCIEGETVDEDILSPDAVLFWNIECKNEKYSNRELFITWNVISVDREGFADDNVFARDAFIAIDVHSRYEVESEKVKNVLSKIEMEALKKGWLLELSNAASFDKKSGLLSISLSITKLLK